MPYYTEKQIEQARSIDLLTYLQTYEPTELVHVRGNIYCTREHDSLKISNGKWMWWSRGFGGNSALDYLIKVKGMMFMDAMNVLIRTLWAVRQRHQYIYLLPGVGSWVLPEQWLWFSLRHEWIYTWDWTSHSPPITIITIVIIIVNKENAICNCANRVNEIVSFTIWYPHLS